MLFCSRGHKEDVFLPNKPNAMQIRTKNTDITYGVLCPYFVAGDGRVFVGRQLTAEVGAVLQPLVLLSHRVPHLLHLARIDVTVLLVLG